MATKTVTTCDLCKKEIKTKPIVLAATRYHGDYPYGYDAAGVVAKFDAAEFCGRQCAIAAVAALLNG